MAEQEITYIPYGLDEISQQDLMASLADGIEGYLGSKRWARKEKNRLAWLNAYQDIMDHGLTGASNSTGVWRISHGKDEINLDNMSNLDKEMYMDAAYYIRLQMSRLTPRKKEEEKKQEDLEDFNFNKSFGNHLLTNYYRGNRDLLYDPNEGWDSLDARDPNTGLRDSKNRKNRLIDVLTSYRNELTTNKDKYKFDNSGFKDYNDVISNIDGAIAALRSPRLDDDNPALNKLGLRSSLFFSNGGNDIYGTDKETGNRITYQQYYEALNKQKEDEAKKNAEVAKLKQQAAYNNTLFLNRVTSPKMLGLNSTALKEKYKDSNSLLTALQGYAQKDIRTLTPDEQSEIHGAYRYLANQPIDNKLLNQIKQSSSGLYRNAAPNRFRKINGIDNLIWDSIAGQVIQINTRQLQQALLNQPTDLFKGILTLLDKEKEYLNSKIPGITNAEWKELSAIGLDIASILNPEAVTGSLMSLGAADLRRRAKNDSNPNWDLGDYFWQGVDYLTGALGGIQVAGDLVLSAKTMATASKAIPILRKIARVGAWADMYHLYPALEATTNKLLNGEELNVEDWRNIGQGIRGLVSHGRLNRGNRAERRVLEKSGLNVTPDNISSMKGKVQNYSLKLGFTRTKPTNTTEVSIVKATVNGKESEIEISSNAKARIQEKVLKAGNSAEARNKAVKEVLESEGKVKASDKVEVEAPNYRDGKRVPGWLGTSRNIFGTKQVSSLLGNDVFNDYISGNRSYWDRYKYGSNAELKGIYNRLNINNNPLNNNQASNSSTKTTETKSNWSLEKIDKYLKNFKNLEDYALNSKNYGKVSSKNNGKIDLSKNIEPGEYLLHDGTKFTVELNNENLIIKGAGLTISKKVSDLLLAKKIVADFIKLYNAKTPTTVVRKFSKEYIDSIKELKRKGFLFKEGGNLDTVIENFLKNNNI